MRIRDAAWAMMGAAVLLVFSGCPGGGWPNQEERLEELSEESVDILVELEDVLNAIEDEQMLKAAVPKVRDRIERLGELDRKMALLLSDGVKLTPEKDKELSGRMLEIKKERLKRDHAVTWEDLEGSEEIAEMLSGFYRQHNERMGEVRKAQKKSIEASLSPKSRQARDDLKALGKIYHQCHDELRKGPDSWSVAENICRKSGGDDRLKTLQRLRDGGTVVHWGISLAQAVIGSSNYVLAYEKSTPKSGGWILHLDGAVQYFEPEALQRALQFQAQVDERVFGQSPPVPVEFPPELTQKKAPPAETEERKRAKEEYARKEAEKEKQAKEEQAARVEEAAARERERIERYSNKGSFGGFGLNADDDADDTGRPSGFRGGRPEAGGMETPGPRSRFGQPAGSTATSAGPTHPDIGQRLGKTKVPFKDSPLVGVPVGRPFRAVSRDGQPVVGVRYRLGQWRRKDAVAKIEGVFKREKEPGQWEYVLAREGYALGAIQVDAGDFVFAVRLAFMRIDGKRLDTKDSYVSQWIGTPSGEEPKTLKGNGAPAIGFHGHSMAVVSAVGLVFAKD